MINLTATITGNETMTATAVSTRLSANIIVRNVINATIKAAHVISVAITSVGAKGESGDKNFVSVLSGQTDIIITHDLDKYPSVTIFDSAGDEVEGDYTHINTAQTRLIFSAGFSGKAIFN